MRIAQFARLLVAVAAFCSPHILLAKDHGGESTPVQGRNWKQYPAIVELPAPGRLFALGDVHGDCDRMLQVLVAAKLVAGVPATAEQVVWTGGSADLVLTGDMIDKYSQGLRVVAVLRALDGQVSKAGGHLVVCLGNHEAEFLASDGDAKKVAEFAGELTAAGISPEEVASGRDAGGIGAWMRNLPAGVRVGDWFFCHAGNTAGKNLPDLESELEKALSTEGFSTPLLIDPNSMLEARMHPRPWWDGESDPGLHDVPAQAKPAHEHGKHAKTSATEATSADHSGPPPKKLTAVVEALSVRHLVIGHQPGKVTFEDGAVRKEGQMFCHYHGLFFMIDTGMSRGVADSAGAILSIEIDAGQTSASAIGPDGHRTLLWHE